MASNAFTREIPEEQTKTSNDQTIELSHERPPNQIHKPTKSELVAPRRFPESACDNSTKHMSTDIVEQRPIHLRKCSVDALSGSIASLSFQSSAPNMCPPIENLKDSIKQVDAPEILQISGNKILESCGDHEKKISEKSSGKDSSSSAKVSDGTSSLAKTSGSAKISGRADLFESGKSSMCRASTSSDVSDESSCSSFSSNVNKPHKANDSRWEAIQVVRARDGALGLSHFRLLKKLGCGDIGSVYLSELSGTKCYFAMKVMDKGSLAGRKKLLRAQTEREILQTLDHPFLPTLYTHFETDKFSCLVMEFCPGGDLHTLRQRQPAKHFTEQAVKYGLYFMSFLFVFLCSRFEH